MSVENQLIDEIDELESELYFYKKKMSMEISRLQKLLSNELSMEEYYKGGKNIQQTKLLREKEKELKKLKQKFKFLEKKISENRTDKEEINQLNNRNIQLAQKRNEKRAKLANQKKKIKDLSKKLKRKQMLSEGLSIIKRWNSNLSAKEDNKVLAKGKKLFIEAKHDWRKAKEEFKENQIDYFIQYSYKALESSVKANYIAFYRENPTEEIMNLIDSLFQKGLIVNTKYIGSLKNMVGRIEDGIEINPQANYINQIFSFFQRNFKILNLI